MTKCKCKCKLFHSIQLQAICDNTCTFLDVFVGHTGSVHEAEKQPHLLQAVLPSTRLLYPWGWWLPLPVPTHLPHDAPQAACPQPPPSSLQLLPVKDASWKGPSGSLRCDGGPFF